MFWTVNMDREENLPSYLAVHLIGTRAQTFPLPSEKTGYSINVDLTRQTKTHTCMPQS